MRVLLRNLDTGAYYAGSGCWVRVQSQAHDFGEVEAANRLRTEPELGRVELVLAYSLPGLRSRFADSSHDRDSGQLAPHETGRPARREGRPPCSRTRTIARKSARSGPTLYDRGDPHRC